MVNILPEQFKSETKSEMHYKKVVYTTEIDKKSGNIIRKVIEIKKDED